MLCKSTKDLYPLTSLSRITLPSALLAAFPDLWHSRLGHPGLTILNSLRSHDLIHCNKTSSSFCTSCPLGNMLNCHFVIIWLLLSCHLILFIVIYGRLPFSVLLGIVIMSFFLDDYSNYLWTFPIANKSQVYSIFLSFQALIKTQFERDIKNIQCHNGWEFDNGPFHSFCKANGVQFCFSCPHTSPKMVKPNAK